MVGIMFACLVCCRLFLVKAADSQRDTPFNYIDTHPLEPMLLLPGDT